MVLDGDLVLRESNAILRHLAAKHGATHLLPADPAGRFREAWLRLTIGNRNRPAIIASITGTEGDPQGLGRQREILSGIATVCGSNADAARLAAHVSRAAF